MKTTKTMLLGMTVFMITLLIVNAFVWYLADTITYKESFAHGATIVIMLVTGWIPSVIVSHDYYYYGQDKSW